MNQRIVWGGGVTLLVAALAGGAYYAWRVKTTKPPVVAAAPAPEPGPAASAAPAIRYPIESMPTLPPADAPAPSGTDHAAVKAALDDLESVDALRRVIA